jgi:hypothetical protein
MPMMTDEMPTSAKPQVHDLLRRCWSASAFTNLTTYESATISVPIDSTSIGLSAEWIAEESGRCPTPLNTRPYYACSYVPFADPAFTSASGSTVSGPLDALVWTRADLIDQHGHVLARNAWLWRDLLRTVSTESSPSDRPRSTCPGG